MPSAKTLPRKALGECSRCGQAAPLAGATCYDCLEAMVAAKHARRDSGICIACWQAPAHAGRRSCVACLQRRSARYQHRKGTLQQAGLCVYCGKFPPWHGRVSCQTFWGKRHKL
jgi:hypothetical protein